MNQLSFIFQCCLLCFQSEQHWVLFSFHSKTVQSNFLTIRCSLFIAIQNWKNRWNLSHCLWKPLKGNFYLRHAWTHSIVLPLQREALPCECFTESLGFMRKEARGLRGSSQFLLWDFPQNKVLIFMLWKKFNFSYFPQSQIHRFLENNFMFNCILHRFLKSSSCPLDFLRPFNRRQHQIEFRFRLELRCRFRSAGHLFQMATHRQCR